MVPPVTPELTTHKLYDGQVVSGVLAVVPTYRPEGDRLRVLVRELEHQVRSIVISDDASPCSVDPILRELARSPRVTVIRHRTNRGIARGLNDGLRLADEMGALWLLTVDQDSHLPADYVSRITASANAARANARGGDVGAVAAGAIDDESGRLRYPVRYELGLPVTEEVIQTGTLWNVSPMVAIGGFDEVLGIDAVDAAACLHLRSAGHRIVLAPDVSVGHRLGSGRQLSLLGRTVMSSGHSPERRTTILRNRLRLFPAEFGQSPLHALRTLRRVAVQTALAVTVEDDRWAKANASARGLLPTRRR